MSSTTRDRLLTRDEAADFLGLRNARTLEVWASTNRYGLPYVKVGRSVRYRLSDLERWLEERTVRPTDD